MRDVWSSGEGVDTHTYETHLYRLRKKVQEKLSDNDFITVKDGIYRLKV